MGKHDKDTASDSNKENGAALKRARAEDFFDNDNSHKKRSKSSKRTPSPSERRKSNLKRPKERSRSRERINSDEAKNSRKGTGRSQESNLDSDSKHRKSRRESNDGERSYKEKQNEQGESDDQYEEGEIRSSRCKLKNKGNHKGSNKKSRRSPHTDRKSPSPLEYRREVEGSRYWSSNRKDNPVFKNKKETKDYEVRPRYYDDPSKTIPESKTPDDDYTIGSRYYEDKPKKMPEQNKPDTAKEEKAPRPARKAEDVFTSRTGGAYIPPAKLRLMQASITDKTSIAYQRIAWEALKKSIHGHINKVNTSNIGIIARLLMKENIIRGRGLLCRSILQAQAASPTFTNVYACLVNVINSKFPNIGELLMKRVILQFKRGFKRNDKPLAVASCQFVAHLVNQQVAHEIIALEILTLLLETPTNDSVEVAVAFLKESGAKLLEVSPKGCNAIFDMLRNILHEGNLEKRVQYMIEVMFQTRKDEFRSFPTIAENLDLVEEEDQYTHIMTLDEASDAEDLLNVFKHDGDYEQNESKYKALKEEIIGESSSEEEDGEAGSDSEDGGSSDEEQNADGEGGKEVTIVDNTETNLVALRRTIYLTIQSSLDFEECCHKLLKMDIKPGQESEVCHMLLDCCAELRSYEKFFGLLAQRFCRINRTYITPFEDMFKNSYATVHRLDTNKLRNVAKFFAHLLYTDAISWEVLETIKLNEEDTTSSSRIFIKILFQELSEFMGLANLNQRLKDPTLQSAMEGLFPRDNPKNTRFAINFFTSIGLGGLTDELREHLNSQPKPSAVPQLVEDLSSSSSSDSSDSSSSESSSSSDSSSESESEDDKRKKNLKPNKEKKHNSSKESGKEKKCTSSKETSKESKYSSSNENSKEKKYSSSKETLPRREVKKPSPRRQKTPKKKRHSSRSKSKR